MIIRSVVALFAFLSIVGCAVSTTSLKKDFGKNDYMSYYTEIPISVSYVSDRSITIFNDQPAGVVYAPKYHIPAEFRLGAEYNIHKGKLMVCPGGKISYLFASDEVVGASVPGSTWGRLYNSSIDPSWIVEPYVGLQMNLSESEGGYFLKTAIGVPAMKLTQNKYYATHSEDRFSEWQKVSLENSSFWTPGVSAKIALHNGCAGIGYDIKYSRIEVSGKRTNFFIHGVLFSLDLRETRDHQ